MTAEMSGLRHEALLHRGTSDFLAEAVPFVLGGLERGEAVLACLGPSRLGPLREALGSAARDVSFADVQELGALIPTWRDFLAAHPGQPVRGVGEAACPGRRAPPSLADCRRHESLLNAVFGGWGRPWHLLCPYDLDTLDDDLIDMIFRTHPHVREDGRSAGNNLCTPNVAVRVVTTGTLATVRGFVAGFAVHAGLKPVRVDDLALAVGELANNSLRHAGGSGVVRIWAEPGRVLCEVSDFGQIADPLDAGRRAPSSDVEDGRGLWIVRQVCDDVEISSSPAGTVVRVQMALAPQ